MIFALTVYLVIVGPPYWICNTIKISFEISLNIFEGYIQIIGTFGSKHYSISTHTKQLKCQTETYLGGTFPSGILIHGVYPLSGEQLDEPRIGLDWKLVG